MSFAKVSYVWLVAGVCYGQIGGGSIVGVVKDTSGAAVAGVRILAHRQDTNEERRSATNAEGYYEFPLLAAGPYRLEAEAAGFEKLRGEVFDLAAGTRPRIDLTLRVGSVSETVEVKAAPSLINTTTTELGVVMPRSRIEELPLNGRNFQDLVELQAAGGNSAPAWGGGGGGTPLHGSAAVGPHARP